MSLTSEASLGSRRGSVVFGVVVGGQVVSMFGSALTAFGLGVWIFQETGSVLQFGIIAFCGSVPATLVAPFAGALVDRWDRRLVILVADALAVAGTVLILVLLAADRLELWHIYLVSLLESIAGAFQRPAFFASIPMLIPKRQFVRAFGLVRTGGSASRILAPLSAGILLELVGLEGLLKIDLITFAVAAVILILVRIPSPERTSGGSQGTSLWSEAGDGWRWVAKRSGLKGLLVVFAGINFGTGMVTVLLTPLVLSFATVAELGVVVSAGATGAFLGGLLITTWGGPKRRRLRAVFGFFATGAAMLSLAGLAPSATWVAAGYFGYMFCFPIGQSCNQAIWQVKVPPDLQGRVVSIRIAIATAAMPVAYLLCGPLADHVFGPMLAEGGFLAASIGHWIGVGPGRGIGLMVLLVAAGNLAVLALGWSRPRVRHLEDDIPDAIGDAPPVPQAPPGGESEDGEDEVPAAGSTS